MFVATMSHAITDLLLSDVNLILRTLNKIEKFFLQRFMVSQIFRFFHENNFFWKKSQLYFFKKKMKEKTVKLSSLLKTMCQKFIKTYFDR